MARFFRTRRIYHGVVFTHRQKSHTGRHQSASAGLQDAYPTIRPYATPPPPIPNAQRPSPQLGNTPNATKAAGPTYAAAVVTPREPIFTKVEKTCPDSRPTRVQNFTPLALSAAEKSVTVQKKQKMTKKKEKKITHSKLSTTPHYRTVG